MSSSSERSSALETTTWVLVLVILVVVIITTVLSAVASQPTPIPVTTVAALTEARRQRGYRRRRFKDHNKRGEVLAQRLRNTPGLNNAVNHVQYPALPVPVVVVKTKSKKEFDQVLESLEQLRAQPLRKASGRSHYKVHFLLEDARIVVVHPNVDTQDQYFTTPSALTDEEDDALGALEVLFKDVWYPKHKTKKASVASSRVMRGEAAYPVNVPRVCRNGA